MKLVSHLRAGEPRLAVRLDDALIDLNLACRLHLISGGTLPPRAVAQADALVPTDVTAFLAGGDRSRDAASAAIDHVRSSDPQAIARAGVSSAVVDATLLPAVPNPPKVVCVARNYAAHAREAGLHVSEIPILFARFPATLIGSGAPIVRPLVSDQLDWEGELAVVIGEGGGRISQGEAMRYVAGYSLFNDVTVRDYQFRVTQYTAGKNFNASGPLGPCLVLADEIPDPGRLELVTTVSGVEMQRASTGDMIFDVPTLIEHISEFIDLEPGDVIATGTPSGVGFKREPPRFLCAGDVVEVSIPEIGTLSNHVVDATGVA